MTLNMGHCKYDKKHWIWDVVYVGYGYNDMLNFIFNTTQDISFDKGGTNQVQIC